MVSTVRIDLIYNREPISKAPSVMLFCFLKLGTGILRHEHRSKRSLAVVEMGSIFIHASKKFNFKEEKGFGQ